VPLTDAYHDECERTNVEFEGLMAHLEADFRALGEALRKEHPYNAECLDDLESAAQIAGCLMEAFAEGFGLSGRICAEYLLPPHWKTTNAAQREQSQREYAERYQCPVSFARELRQTLGLHETHHTAGGLAFRLAQHYEGRVTVCLGETDHAHLLPADRSGERFVLTLPHHLGEQERAESVVGLLFSVFHPNCFLDRDWHDRFVAAYLRPDLCACSA
jgi:hypothetical protein